MLTQQHTLDSGRKLSANTNELPRRASVSVPITHSSGGECSKRKISSFEDTASAVTSASSSSTVFAIPSDEDNKRSEEKPPPPTNRTFKKSHSLAKTLSVVGAPIISVSSAVDYSDDRQEDAYCQQKEDVGEEELEPMAPLAEPDSESPASEFPPSEPGENLDGDAAGETKSNDVCPWENE